jgi:hypothetical protein
VATAQSIVVNPIAEIHGLSRHTLYGEAEVMRVLLPVGCRISPLQELNVFHCAC